MLSANSSSSKLKPARAFENINKEIFRKLEEKSIQNELNGKNKQPSKAYLVFDSKMLQSKVLTAKPIPHKFTVNFHRNLLKNVF